MARSTRIHNKISVHLVILASAILLFGLATAAPAQQTLGDLVREGGLEWLLGRWTSTLGEDTKVQLVYRWTIKDRLITADLKTGDYAYHGMIFISPDEQQVVEIGVDSNGGCAKGTWGPDGMDAVSTGKLTDAQGKTERFALVHSKVDDKTMRVTLHQVDENGVRAKQASVVMEYKRGAAKASGKTTTGKTMGAPRKKGEPQKKLSIGVNTEKKQ